MDQGRELATGVNGPRDTGSASDGFFAAEVSVRRLSWFEQLLIRGGLVVLGAMLLLVLLPVVLLLIVLLVAYVAGALLVAGLRGSASSRTASARRNVRVRGPAQG